jgi:hypothetical protein
LEQPDRTASAISDFLASDVVESKTSFLGGAQNDSQPPYIVGAGFFGALAISGVLNLLSAH